MDNRTIKQVRENEDRLINENKKLREIIDNALDFIFEYEYKGQISYAYELREILQGKEMK